MKRIYSLTIATLLLNGCGDFPDYRYEKAEQSCMLSFPFAAGILKRQYIGYFNIISSLQYLDSEPEINIFIGGPSHIELEVGSVQKIEINDQFFVPEFHKNYLQAEYQYWGSGFTFDQHQSKIIYQALQAGFDMTIYGRVEVGHQYQSEILNWFFDDTDEPYQTCINRLLSEDDIKAIKQSR